MTANEQSFNFSPEKFRKAAENYQEDLEKWIYPGGKKPNEDEIRDIQKWMREFPNNLTQYQKDKMFEAYQKVRAELDNDDENEHRIKDFKEWINIHILGQFYVFYKVIEMYEFGISIRDIANEFGTCEGMVRFYLESFERL